MPFSSRSFPVTFLPARLSIQIFEISESFVDVL